MKNKLNVLLVDDSELIISHLKNMLSNVNGITIAGSAGTLPTAQQMVKNHAIDAIVLDIQLPDGNGIDFSKWVRFTNPKITVIMLSNQADECHRAAARMAGAKYFFDKSHEFQQVSVVLSQLADKL
ncbi:MAG TPA: response regulator transcription factor [Bacteroidia bacterium]|jgi:two-component system OmpR family response regulator|nr:response regulator transcription factor [Bacteroidia bacterium]